MSSARVPEFKIFRWLISHLSLIVVLSVIFYLFWSYWSQERAETTIEPSVKLEGQLPEKKISSNKSDEVVTLDNYSAEEKTMQKKASGLPAVTSSYAASNFSRRMNEYKHNLSPEGKKVMENAGRTFYQQSEQVIRYPTDSDLKTIEITHTVKTESNQVKASGMLFPAELHKSPDTLVASVEAFDEPIETFNKSVETIDKPVEVFNKPAEAFNKPVETLNKPVETFNKPVETLNKLNIKKAPFNISVAEKEQQVSALSANEDVKAQEKNLQKQIRDRQKKLQEQMILLIPLNSEDVKKKSDRKTISTINTVSVKPVKPLIHTAEQQQLLSDARRAFELHHFNTAEKKYLQLLKQLPELPDIAGELANVYKTQNKIPDYLVANIQFVKRLVNHNRFNEAWKVVAVTDKIDKNAANKQRRIIHKKQKDL